MENTQKQLTVQKMHDILCVINTKGGDGMFTDILKERRKILNFSQQIVADEVGIERSYYTKIENGLIPSVKVAQSIGVVLDIEWTNFFCLKLCKKCTNETCLNALLSPSNSNIPRP